MRSPTTLITENAEKYGHSEVRCDHHTTKEALKACATLKRSNMFSGVSSARRNAGSHKPTDLCYVYAPPTSGITGRFVLMASR